MLQIPVKLNLEAGEAVEALKKFEKGAEDAIKEIVDLNGKKINVDFKFSVSGDPVVKELNEQEVAIKKVEKAYDKLTGGQERSIGRTRKQIKQFKEERDKLDVTSRAYREKAAQVKKYEDRLRKLSFVQKGSITDLKAQRQGLIEARDAASIGSVKFQDLSKQISELDKELGRATPKANTFVKALANIAIAAAAFKAIGSTFRSVGNAIDVYVRRTKQVESFNLAIQNVGFSQVETNRIFKQAETTAKSLGAPLQQVENSYKRMIPALKGIGASAAESDKFIEAISARSQTLGLNTEQSGRLLEAFAQVLSKGKLQAEELNQQISELDGSFRTQLADALGVTTVKLGDMIKGSRITADVFVKAVNRMQNGAAELRKRVEEGNLTIQQFQNQLKTIETKNLEKIGEAIKPAIKSFLSIRLAIAEFIQEFSKTEAFKNLVIVFNGIAKGAEQFVQSIIKIISTLNEFLEPITATVNSLLRLGESSGGLVGILTKLALTFGITTAAIMLFRKALSMKQNFVEFIAGSKGAAAGVKGVGFAALKALPLAAALLLTLEGYSVIYENATKSGKAFSDNLKEVANDMEALGRKVKTTEGPLQEFAKFIGGISGLSETLQFNDLMSQINNYKTSVSGAKKGLKELGVDTTKFNTISKLTKQQLQDQIKIFTKLRDATDERISQLETEIKAEEDANRGKHATTKMMRVLLSLLKKNQTALKFDVMQLEKSADARKNDAHAAKLQIQSLENFGKATDKAISTIEIERIKAGTEAIKEFGREANAASLLAAADIGAEAAASEARLKVYREEIDLIKANGSKKAEEQEKEKARILELTQLTAKETQTQAKLGIEARNAVIDAFEEGIQQANQKVDILAGAASKLRGAFNNIAGSFTSGLSVAVGLIDELISREAKGLEVGSEKRKQLIRIQLKAQAVAAEAENNLAQMKLRVQNKIAQSEARIAQLRLQSEAKIAEAKGEVDLAKTLQDAAAVQGEVIRGLETQFQIESTVLDLQKQQTNEKLISKGLEEQIGESSGQVARTLGLQNTNLVDAVKNLKNLEAKSGKYANQMAKAATAAQENTEAAQELSLEEGMEQAKEVKKALDGAKGAAEAFKKIGDTINDPFNNVKNTTEQIASYLEDAVKEAQTLASIIASGTGRRAMGGPVNAGQTYKVNDGGGREGFLSNTGAFKMLPAARNMNWTAPTSGTVIPANLVDQYRNMYDTNRPNLSMKGVKVDASKVNGLSASLESGNLVQRIASAMSHPGGNQRITNHVTIQSQQPVTDASKIMTNVARAKLRRAGGI